MKNDHLIEHQTSDLIVAFIQNGIEKALSMLRPTGLMTVTARVGLNILSTQIWCRYQDLRTPRPTCHWGRPYNTIAQSKATKIPYYNLASANSLHGHGQIKSNTTIEYFDDTYNHKLGNKLLNYG